jgi:hypothetical protein
VAKVVSRVKLVTELAAEEPTEELAYFGRDEQLGLADLGLSLAEAKPLQAAIVPTQVTVVGELICPSRRPRSICSWRTHRRSPFSIINQQKEISAMPTSTLKPIGHHEWR